SMDTEQLKQEPQTWELRSKPAWQRLIIMLGGVTVNYMLAFLIYIGLVFAYGELDIKNSDVKDGIWVTNPVLEQAGLQTGDKVIAVDGKPVDKFFELPEKIILSHEIVVDRNGTATTINTPVNLIGQIVDENKKLAIALRIPFVVVGAEDNSPNKDALRIKDIVTHIDGQEIQYVDQLADLLKNYKNQVVTAKVLRDNQEIETPLKVNHEGKIGIAYAS